MTGKVLRNTEAAPIVGMTPKPDDETQTAIITKELTRAFNALAPSTAAVDGAKEDLTTAQTKAGGLRQKLMVELAQFSIAHKCEEKWIADACTKATEQWQKGRNAKDNTTQTFCAELRRAMHPNAREHVAGAFDSAEKAWDAETAERDAWKALDAESQKNTPKPATPLADAFSRKYHMVVSNKGMLQSHIDAATKKNPDVTATQASTPSVLAQIRGKQEREDPKRAAKLMERLSVQLSAIYAEFPDADIATMIDYANAIDAKALEKAKVRANAKAKATAKVAPKASKKPVVVEDEDLEDAINNLAEDE